MADVRITQETQNFIEVTVNGRSLGKKPVNGTPSIKDLATELAQEHGIRSFTVSIDDAVVTNEQVNEPIQSGARVNLQAKDSRGAGKNKAGKATPEAAPATPPLNQAEDEHYEEVTGDEQAAAEPIVTQEEQAS